MVDMFHYSFIVEHETSEMMSSWIIRILAGEMYLLGICWLYVFIITYERLIE